MTLPNWFRVFWWLALLAALTMHLYHRYYYLIRGDEVFADIVIFLVWVCLAIFPVVSEINLFGLSLKKEIDEVERKLSSQIYSLKAEIQNSVAASSNSNSHVTVNNLPPPDSQLPQIEAVIVRILNAEMKNRGISPDKKSFPSVDLADDVVYLAAIRINLEKEIRRIYELFKQQTVQRPASVHEMIRVLIREGAITPNLAHAIGEVYRVCSAAIHGAEVTGAQIAFVRDVAPNLISTLRAS